MRVMNVNSVIWNHQELLEEIYLKIFIYSRLSMVLEKQLGQDQGLMPGVRSGRDNSDRGVQGLMADRSGKNVVKFMPTKKSSFRPRDEGIKSKFSVKKDISGDSQSDLSSDQSEKSETSEGDSKAKAKAKIGRPKSPIGEGRLEILDEVDDDSGSGSGSGTSDSESGKTSSESDSDAFDGGHKENVLAGLAGVGLLGALSGLPSKKR